MPASYSPGLYCPQDLKEKKLHLKMLYLINIVLFVRMSQNFK